MKKNKKKKEREKVSN